jgi:hypothetical protein
MDFKLEVGNLVYSEGVLGSISGYDKSYDRYEIEWYLNNKTVKTYHYENDVVFFRKRFNKYPRA